MIRPSFALTVIAVLSGCGPKSSVPPASSPIAPVLGAAPRFVDVTDSMGIRFRHQSSRTPRKYFIETMGSGCAFLDFDANGWQDILLLNNRQIPGGAPVQKPSLKLYRNEKGKKFTDVTESAGLGGFSRYAMGITAGDYDNDGHVDIYISCVLDSGRLYRNLGDGKFADVTESAGVSNAGKWGTSCAWLDYDMDGRLDLFIANYVKYRTLADDLPCYAGAGRDRVYCIPSAYETSACTLFRNMGNGRFSDVSAQSGIAAFGGKALGVTVWDYDDDGDPDIFVANDTVAGFLFRNEGNGKFKEIGVESGVAYDEEGNPHSGMGTDTGDLFNDGKTWLSITNYQGQQTSMYRNSAKDIFTDERHSAKIAEPTTPVLGFGILFFDYDLDGFRDIVQVNGHVQDNIANREPDVSYPQPTLVFRNLHNGTFEEVGRQSPFTEKQVWRGCAAADYDNDGRMDLLLTSNNGPARLLRNETAGSGNWIGIRAIGLRSPASGHGAKVIIKHDGVIQRASVRSGSSYLSQSDLRAHFGLGASDSADLEVRWPSGQVGTYRGLTGGRYWAVTEGSPSADEVKYVVP